MEKELVKERFKNTSYTFGFEFIKDKDGHEGIAYGIGWGQIHLYEILIRPDKIEYRFSHATNGRLDKIKELPFSDNFLIPKDTNEFYEFLIK